MKSWFRQDRLGFQPVQIFPHLASFQHFIFSELIVFLISSWISDSTESSAVACISDAVPSSLFPLLMRIFLLMTLLNVIKSCGVFRIAVLFTGEHLLTTHFTLFLTVNFYLRWSSKPTSLYVSTCSRCFKKKKAKPRFYFLHQKWTIYFCSTFFATDFSTEQLRG